ncbi:NIPSNAP family containing protein [Chitinophaga sp. SYP-B3965]|uniref:NIPSNAP family protein n=1 Tax=Chitinophaga sp. SYP-B3965 TaxID=2663120 RepID=UPI0012999E99|nr:NIPSNAP family protein [Chitinophaga sp. SYP-B3965]MRG48273.1 NIPSNAP family containing protein [Chitinophaga sp. SYP-B3965]
MKNSTLSFLLFIFCSLSVFAGEKPPAQEYYQIRVYHLKTDAQVEMVENYLNKAYLPALHRAGIKQVGVFKPIAQDTADLRIYVLVPFKTLTQFENLPALLAKDATHASAGKDYLDAPHDNKPYARIENILLLAFKGMPVLTASTVTSPKSERVYELRSYESPTEKYAVNKIKMFNDGDEFGIFRKLNFNTVFCGEVLAGSKMPNLMYMTTFKDKADRDAHWKAFSADPDWKKLSAVESYKNNVSKNEQLFIRPTEYSDL